MTFTISDSDKRFLLSSARKTIADHLDAPYKMDLTGSEQLDFNSGCFVTISINGQLRGCIGNFRNDIQITENIIDMAHHAAFSDHRFPPLSLTEYGKISIEISVLSPMIPIEDINNIVVGRDGLYIRKGHQSGVLLPQVATEYNWRKEEFLDHTCMKAGLPADSWQKTTLDIFRFEALIFNENDI